MVDTSKTNQVAPSQEQAKPSVAGLTHKDQADIANLKFPEDLSGGPIRNRRCTDILMGLLFFAFCLGMCAAAGYGWYFGNPKLLVIGWDSDYNGCGYSNATQGYPYLYWPVMPNATQITALTSGNGSSAQNAAISMLSKGMCVANCPSGSQDDPIVCRTTSALNNDYHFKNCSYYPYAYQSGGTNYTLNGTAFRYATKSLLGSFCMPADAGYVNKSQAAYDSFKTTFLSNIYGQQTANYFHDIAKTWPVFLIAAIATVILSYLYLFVIRLVGGFIIAISFIVAILICVAGGLYSYFYARPKYDPANPIYNYLAYAAYVCWGLAGLVVLAVICCYDAIKIGIAVFKTTSMYVQNTMQIFLLPLVSCIQICLWFVFWLFAVVYIWSVGTPGPRDGFPFVTEMKWDKSTRYIFFYHCFGLLWINSFLVGCCQFVIGASACIWYFESNSDSKGKGSVLTGVKWVCIYHWASVAFGALIIAICQVIRIVFEYYRKKLGVLDKAIPWVKVLITLTGYLLWLLENCIKYITKNAYIQIALTNNSFFKSAWNAFALIIKNAHRFGFTASIGGIFLGFGVFSVSACISGATYLFMTNQISLMGVTSPIPTTVVAGIIAACLCMLFLSIFSFASDAILQSFLMDEELGFSGNSRPQYMQEFANTLKNRGKSCCSSFTCW